MVAEIGVTLLIVKTSTMVEALYLHFPEASQQQAVAVYAVMGDRVRGGERAISRMRNWGMNGERAPAGNPE